jgi:hypothetical protein
MFEKKDEPGRVGPLLRGWLYFRQEPPRIAASATAPIAGAGSMSDLVGVGRSSAGTVNPGGVANGVVCTICPPDPMGGTMWTMYTEIVCGQVIRTPVLPAQEEEACPLTKLTMTPDPSFLLMYVSTWPGRRSCPIGRVSPISTLTNDVLAVQVVPEQVERRCWNPSGRTIRRGRSSGSSSLPPPALCWRMCPTLQRQ